MIREATESDVDAAVRTLQAAFADYPFTRHTIAADDHLDRLARSQRLFVERIGLPHGRVWVSDEVDAVAVWTTPDCTDIDAVFTALAPELGEIAGERLDAAAATEDVLEPYRPTTPCWFLATVGVRPDRQGRGLGRAVIEPGLAEADAGAAESYLETSLSGNVALYRKLGFEILAEVDLPGGGPRTWAMRREPVR